MPITRISRGNFLHGVGNRAVRAAINAMSQHVTTSYDITSAGQSFSGTTLTPSTNLILDNLIGGVFYTVTGLLNLSISAAAGNVKLDYAAGTCQASNVSGTTFFTATGTATTLAVDSTALNTTVSGGTTTAWTKAWIDLSFYCTQTGTFNIDVAQVAASGTLSVLNGSWILAAPLDQISQY